MKPWSEARPLIMQRQHWWMGWCTFCSARLAAYTPIELYRAYADHGSQAERGRWLCKNAPGSSAIFGHRIRASCDIPREAVIDYTNWKGVRSTRRIRPIQMRYGYTDWHKVLQQLLVAVDLEKNERRSFAMKDIHDWLEGDRP